jgi:hypothetical protein
MVVRSESGAAAMRQKALNALARDVAAAQAEADFGRALSYAVRACEEAAAVAASVLTARGESAQGTARERFARLADLGVLEPALAAACKASRAFPRSPCGNAGPPRR